MDAAEKKKLMRYMRGMMAQPYSMSSSSKSARWPSLVKACTSKAWNTTCDSTDEGGQCTGQREPAPGKGNAGSTQRYARPKGSTLGPL